MPFLRKFIFWTHLLVGSIAGLIIFVMSATGVLLAFEPQILRFAEREMRSVAHPAGVTQRLSPGAIIKTALAAQPGARPTSLTLQADATAAASLSLGREGVLFLNPYSGEVLGKGSETARHFFHVVTDWHRWLGREGESRELGRAITGACNAGFLLLAASGIYLWWPKEWTTRYLIPVTLFRPGLKGRARDFNWHNVTGFWCSWLLMLITVTALVMSYPWANNLLFKLTGNEPPARPGGAPEGGAPANMPGTPQNARIPSSRSSEESRPAIPENLDKLWLRAEHQVAGWESISLRLPQRSGSPLVFSITESASWNPSARSQLTVDPRTTEIVKWEPYSELNLGRTLRSWVRPVHTGEAGGFLGQLLACLASLSGVFLVWTGWSLAWRRFQAWTSRRWRGMVVIYEERPEIAAEAQWSRPLIPSDDDRAR